jgi:RNA polymerase sigma-70 factor (ECF subfamily)
MNWEDRALTRLFTIGEREDLLPKSFTVESHGYNWDILFYGRKCMDDNLELIWEQYHQRLEKFIRSRVQSDEVEDILQEVFIRIHRHLCCQVDWQKPDGWFYQIARNLIIDHYRKRADHAELSEDHPAQIEFAEDEPEAELALSLKDMVTALPEPYREALLLTEFQGLTQKQLAEAAGISLSGAKSRVQRARGVLKDMLLTCCHFEFDRRGSVMDYYEHCCCCSAQNESDSS